MSTKRAAKTISPDEPQNPLFPEYLEQFVNFTQAFFARAHELASEEPDLQPTVRILADTANEATRQIARELRATYDEANTRPPVN